MPTYQTRDFPNIDVRTASVEQLRAHVEQMQQYLTQMQRDMKYYLENLDYQNIFAVGGWRVEPERLYSKDGDVGMSTEDTAGDDIRFWAGDEMTGSPPFIVRKSGKMQATDGEFTGTISASTINGSTVNASAINGGTITGALIRTATSAPMVELSNTDNLFRAINGAGGSVSIKPYQSLGVPNIEIDNGTDRASLFMASGNLSISTTGFPTGITLGSARQILLSPGGGYTVQVPSWSSFSSISGGGGSGQTLQQALDDINGSISSLSSSLSGIYATLANHESRISALESAPPPGP